MGILSEKKIARLAKQYGIDKDTDKFWIETTLLINYIESYPEEFNRFIGQVPDEIQDALLQNKHFLNSVPEIFKNYQPFDNFRIWLFYRKRLVPKMYRDKNLKSKIDNIKLSVFEEKIRKWDNPRDIRYLLKALKEVEYERLNDILEGIGPGVFEEKIRKWDYPWGIGDLLKALKEVEYERLNEINKAVFEEKIREWDNENDNEHLEKILKRLHYPHLKKLKELLEPTGLWLID